jgi:hypothetical protein
MPDAVNDSGINGWVVESRRSNYSFGYWAAFVIGMLSQSVSSAPEITYTLRNSISNEKRTVTLPGDHKPSDLADAIRAPK